MLSGKHFAGQRSAWQYSSREVSVKTMALWSCGIEGFWFWKLEMEVSESLSRVEDI